jgi:hypothetical protein
MKTVSVTELLAWKQCRAAWALRYRDGWVPKAKAINLSLGTVVHMTIEALIRGTIDKGDVEDYADRALTTELNGDMDKINRYRGGVLHSVNQVPPWIWEEEWNVEELLEQTYDDTLTVRYKPDLYRRQDGVLEIIDFKNSDKMPLAYLLDNPQLPWYGALLHQRYPDDLIQFRYIMLPRDTRKRGRDHEPWPLMPQALQAAEDEMLGWAREVGELDTVRNRGFWCSNCDYSPVTRVALTGGDISDILDGLYDRRER